MNRLVWGLLFSTAIMQGCGRMIVATAVAPQMEQSKYNPTTFSESDWEAYFTMLDSINKQVVSDNLGTYYHERVGPDGVYKVWIRKDDEAALKSLMSGSVGLMEPVYVLNTETKIVVDWNLTQQRYEFLTKSMGLKLLPLQQTKLYHELINRYIEQDINDEYSAIKAGEASMIASAFNRIGLANAGDHKLYSSRFYADILSKIPEIFDYLIENGGAEDYAFWHRLNILQDRLPPQVKDKQKIPIQGVRSHGLAQNIKKYSSIEFVPVDYFKALISGGAFRSNSGCRYINKTEGIEQVKYNNDSTDILYVSGIAKVFKERTSSAIAENKTLLLKLLKEDAVRRKQTEQACMAGFKALDISGVVESRRLK